MLRPEIPIDALFSTEATNSMDTMNQLHTTDDFDRRLETENLTARDRNRPKKTRSVALGFTLFEAMVALVLSGVGITILYRSLNDVGRNSLDTMNRQGGAMAMESALESVKRMNSVSTWVTLDSTWIDSGQKIPFRIRALGAPVDTSLTRNCSKPSQAALLMAKMTLSVARVATDPKLARDSFSATTVLFGAP